VFIRLGVFKLFRILFLKNSFLDALVPWLRL
jgi:hypothetical protein